MAWAWTACLAASLVCSAAFAAEGDAEETPAEPPSEVALKLEQARKEIDQLNYTEAQQVLLGIVQSGKASAEQLSSAYCPRTLFTWR
jgi:hypothetical protein